MTIFKNDSEKKTKGPSPSVLEPSAAAVNLSIYRSAYLYVCVCVFMYVSMYVCMSYMHIYIYVCMNHK